MAGLLCISSQSAMADTWVGTWDGHLATLEEAKIACQDTSSTSCLPYMAQAVAVADTLQAQANYKNQSEVQVPGLEGSILTCDPSIVQQLNGEDLMYLALATEPTDGWPFYWDDALFRAALKSCR